ncbi:carbohydrate porin [Rhodopirellula sallentina]|uniref:carbohydrate porin n=1 Tax=Rhodopirellula sallentina TaxID=1263869 RepID=UPI00034492F4|nr:carbohydrate porin [Rhodopirellula sallentina]
MAPFLYYDSICAANVDGGIQSDEDFTGQIYAGVDLDLEKLCGCDSTIMKVSMVERHGESISESVGGIYDPMCIFGGQVGYLYQLWVEKTFCENWAMKFGRVSADTDFANNNLYRYSLSTAINGPIRAMLLENIITSFPYPVWGGRLKYSSNDRNQLQVGVYQIGESMWDFRKHGLDFSIRDDDGVSLLVQYDWTPQVCERPARVSLGMVKSFFEFDNFTGGGATDQFLRLYTHIEMELFEGTRTFLFASHSDEGQVAKTPVQISVGINRKGLIPNRPDDRTVFFATYGELSDEYGVSVGESVDYEGVFELGHRVQICPTLYVQPALQYVVHPGGTGDIANSTILGAWIGAAF